MDRTSCDARDALWEGSPLAGALARATSLMPYATFVAGTPRSDDGPWFALESLHLPEMADHVIGRIADERADGDLTVGATFTFRYAIANALRLAGYLFARERRVPVLRDNVLLADRQWLTDTAVLAPRAVVLPDDALAGTPGIRSVPNEAALTDALFEEADAIAEPLLEAFTARRLMARANGRASAIDALAYGFLMAGRDGLGMNGAWQAWREASSGRSFPVTRRPRRFQFEVDGEEDEMLVRSSCCLYFMLPRARAADEEARYCTSCYIETDEHRLARMTEYKRRVAAEARVAAT